MEVGIINVDQQYTYNTQTAFFYALHTFYLIKQFFYKLYTSKLSFIMSLNMTCIIIINIELLSKLFLNTSSFA